MGKMVTRKPINRPKPDKVYDEDTRKETVGVRTQGHLTYTSIP